MAVNVILFGATGMIGQGVLRECLHDPGVQTIRIVVRSATGIQHIKLKEIIHEDFFQYSSVKDDLRDCDACFFCLGISSAGMKEVDYRKVTYDITLAAARALLPLNPNMTFIYVSGVGTDTTEKGRSMWARVKGGTENALLRMPFKAAYMFRFGFVEPLHGIKSRTAVYRFLYTLGKPLLPLLKQLLPSQILTTEQIGRAMLIATRCGAPKQVLGIKDIRALAASLPTAR